MRTQRLVLAAVAVCVAAVAAGIVTLDRSNVSTATAPSFVNKQLGAPLPTAPLSRTVAARTKATILPSGYEVSSPAGSLSLTQPAGGSKHWAGYANGTARPTSYGNEAIVLGGSRADGEQYLTVRKHEGVHTWTWQ